MTSPPERRPDVTVVIRVHNDRYVTEAVRSALAQTLRTVELVVVDHGSTDGTSEAVDRLARSDPRIRVIHLGPGGGPGRPGNVGIDAARGRYLMFLDSDDVLEPDACRILLSAAEVFGADLVCSLIQRVHGDAGRRLPWYPDLYRERYVVQDIRERPRQLWDQVPLAKLFRSDWLRERDVRFLDDGVYEDQYLCLAAYVRAGRIAVIPDATYRWMARPKDTRKSITHSRSEVQNLLDRITANEQMDVLLRQEGAEDLRPEKDGKFLRHDLAIHARELWQRDLEHQKSFLERVGAYVEGIDEEVLAAQPAPVRALVWFLRRRDLEGVHTVAAYLASPGCLLTDVVVRDGRTYWTERYLDTEEGRRWLDVSDLKLDRVPAPSRHLGNELHVLRATDGVLTVAGEIRNLLGTVPQDADVRVRVRVQPRRGGAAVHFAGKDVVNDGKFLRFTADLDLAGRLPMGLRRTQAWDVYVEVRWNGLTNVTQTSVTDPETLDVTVPVAPRLGALVGNAVLLEATARGTLGLVLVNNNERGVRLGDATIRAARKVHADKVLHWGHRAVEERVKPAYFTLCKALPPQRDTVLFESFQGRQYSTTRRWCTRRCGRSARSCGPCGAMRPHAGERASRRTPISCDGRAGPTTGPGPGRLSGRQLRFSHVLPAEEGHDVSSDGTRDTAEVGPVGPRAHPAVVDVLAVLAGIRRPLGLRVVPNDYYRAPSCAVTTRPGRNPRGFPPRRPRQRIVIRGRRGREAALGLPLDRTIVLYTPTWRRAAAGVPLEFPNLAEMAEALGDEYYLLVRQHYYRRGIDVPQELAWFARDVSASTRRRPCCWRPTCW